MNELVSVVVVAGFTALFMSVLVSIVSLLIHLISFRQVVKHQTQMHSMIYTAEATARRLLEHGNHPLYSFAFLRHRLSGHTDEEVRKTLIRAGAVRLDENSGDELWGLINRNPKLVGFEAATQPAKPSKRASKS